MTPRALEGHAWGNPVNFMDLPVPLTSWEASASVVLPIPYEATVSWGAGTKDRA